MKLPNDFREPAALVVLNASRDALLRDARAKTLHNAGYYTSSAHSAEEAITLATQMKCAIVIVCHSFTAAERRLIEMRIQRAAPATTVILLGNSSDNNPQVLLSTIRAALSSTGTPDFGYRPV